MSRKGEQMATRREFIDAMAVGAATVALGVTAKSYARIAGSNERLNFAIIGLNSRGYAHLAGIQANKDSARVAYVCDVDSEILQKFADTAQKQLRESSIAERDFRKVLDSRDVDAITIATPDHWHAPMAIAALQAGKHVYLEKPCSHNPAEGEMLLEAQRKYGKLVQLGTQQRSSPHTIDIIQKIREGIIGRPYFAKAWYINTRKSIGHGKEISAPARLDWNLWQGPAPHRPYTDNLHPYNWHWFRIYGTGESLNNGTHEVDVCRWALAVDYPNRVTAAGGRYHFKDDWQFYDTLVTSFEYGDSIIAWEGKSCQGMKYYDRDRGSTIMGTTGTVLVDRDGYEIFDLAGKKVDAFKAGSKTSSADLVGRDSMTDAHFANFIRGVRQQEKLNAPISDGNVSVTMLHLSNIAWKVNRELHLDPKDGHIQGDSEAARLWSREYEKGWEPKI
jgi:predicted dehydrogenase